MARYGEAVGLVDAFEADEALAIEALSAAIRYNHPVYEQGCLGGRGRRRAGHGGSGIQHFIRGVDKVKLRVGLVFAVILAMALGYIKQGRAHQMRPLARTQRQASG
ncbi:hypothetical protein ACCAA_1740005 [Candidatus Accumulibacter aalborgensis]|uniref:Uncharacterized protein n=1 Tax=Candidatus Accumulibacter aalborgensis TaxID=1860102 RepID=A0A1A8XIZ4_9PROT|nr:hypothetical protein [Candidatus Accumulibacter aalborgensis]SBT04666.1 hypothetical protein ACCAA_1740005 [Candidatus Accumulibacter aalborgensis]